MVSALLFNTLILQAWLFLNTGNSYCVVYKQKDYQVYNNYCHAMPCHAIVLNAITRKSLS